MKHLALALLATTLLAGPAVSQSTQQQQQPSNQPAASNQAASQRVTMQKSGQWRTSKMVGLNVYNSQNEKIGDINELINDQSGKIDLVVIGVGGFLGLGERNVALQWNQVKFVDQPPRTASTSTSDQRSASDQRPADQRAASDQRASDQRASQQPAAQRQTTGTSTSASTVREYPDHAMVNMTKDQLRALPEFKFASQASRDDQPANRPANEPAQQRR